MAFKIGFNTEYGDEEKNRVEDMSQVEKAEIIPRKSLVQVGFPNRDKTLAYYNDKFDLHRGDRVFAEGKLEGILGVVVSVNYNFKIKACDYKKVIGLSDTDVKGEFSIMRSHFITFDPSTIPADKVYGWYMPPKNEEEEILTGSDGAGFFIENFEEMDIKNDVRERGYGYYFDDRVIYLSINSGRGYALVKGSRIYEVEFNYINNEISDIVCSCFCSYICKHEVAAMLLLRELLGNMEEEHLKKYEKTGYFAALSKVEFFSFVVDEKNSGMLLLK